MTDNKAAAAGESQFDKLIGDLGLGDLSKALKTDDAETSGDDAKIAAAAADGEAAEGEGEDDGKGAPLGKALKVTMADGSEMDAVDGTELVKSLIERLENNETTMAKALTDVAGALTASNELVKSLQGKVDELSTKGVGRKTMLAITEVPAGKETEMAKSEKPGMDAAEFMAKSVALNAKGLVTSREISEIEMHLNAGQQPPQHIVTKVAGLLSA